ncbi:MAG: ATP-binding protein [Candidatus Cloacimonetes bacterium]|nr:ATP-binding protein [Candidatus Cloacimonadota bacterium]MBL7149003.1 ATP-binding protein [Candidatus Cloacimonadota bacterium]
MIYKNFKINCSVRIILISITMLLTFISVYNLGFSVTPILLGVITILQISSMFQYIQKTNRYLTTFLDSIRYSDFSRSFKIEGLGTSYDGLKEAFNNVIGDFQKIRSEKEEHYFYLQNVIQHIGISLIAYRKDGTVEIINNSAKKMFQVSRLKNIENLKNFSSDLVKTLKKMKPGERTLIRTSDEDQMLQLAVYATEFKLRNRSITLVSIQNIQSELEEQEMAAWQKLISVLTHEMMNSITPIASLSATVAKLLKDIDTTDNIPQEIDDETVEDIRKSMMTINKRSTGLIRFVESYRDLTKIPKPEFEIVPVKNIFDNVKLLMEEELQKNNISCKRSIIPETLEVTADQQQIEQVLLNLLKNSQHALEGQENGKMELNAFLDKRGKVAIQVVDNGPGILEDVIDKIFIPFFTTKASGSGIGLSLSRQIMRFHGGTITANSEPNVKTEFSLKF